MTILVTGGAGYIGSHCVLSLLDAGESVIVVDNLLSGDKRLVPEGVDFFCYDVGDKDRIGSLLRDYKIETIFHFAGLISVSESVTDPLSYYDVNVIRGHRLLETALSCGVRYFIFSSSAAVYGSPEVVPVVESAPLRPISPYGASKMMFERILSDVGGLDGSFSFCGLRYFNVAGADSLCRSGQLGGAVTHLVRVACRSVLRSGGVFPIYGRDYSTPDGTCIRDYIHVSDLADAHVRALDYLRGGSDSVFLNCGYSRGFSVLDVIGSLERVSGLGVHAYDAPRRLGDPAVLVSDSTLFRSVLSFVPRYDNLDEIVASAFAWEERLLSEARFKDG